MSAWVQYSVARGCGLDILAQFLAPGEDRADAVDGDVQFGADLLVGAAFQVVHANDLAFAAGSLFRIFSTSSRLSRPICRLGGSSGLAEERSPPCGCTSGRPCDGQLVNADPPGDHGEVGRETAVALELAQDGVILDTIWSSTSAAMSSVSSGRGECSAGGRCAGDVIDQAEETVDELVPGSGLVIQAPLEQARSAAVSATECPPSQEPADELPPDDGCDALTGRGRVGLTGAIVPVPASRGSLNSAFHSL